MNHEDKLYTWMWKYGTSRHSTQYTFLQILINNSVHKFVIFWTSTEVNLCYANPYISWLLVIAHLNDAVHKVSKWNVCEEKYNIFIYLCRCMSIWRKRMIYLGSSVDVMNNRILLVAPHIWITSDIAPSYTHYILAYFSFLGLYCAVKQIAVRVIVDVGVWLLDIPQLCGYLRGIPWLWKDVMRSHSSWTSPNSLFVWLSTWKSVDESDQRDVETMEMTNNKEGVPRRRITQVVSWVVLGISDISCYTDHSKFVNRTTSMETGITNFDDKPPFIVFNVCLNNTNLQKSQTDLLPGDLIYDGPCSLYIWYQMFYPLQSFVRSVRRDIYVVL